jgi:hypothetical protein
MGNVLRRPTLGAITPNFPHVLTDQLVNKPPRLGANKQATTITSDSDDNVLYYIVIAVAALYFLKRG